MSLFISIINSFGTYTFFISSETFAPLNIYGFIFSTISSFVVFELYSILSLIGSVSNCFKKLDNILSRCYTKHVDGLGPD